MMAARFSERFWAKVDRTERTPAPPFAHGSCWPWTAATRRDGYGVIGADDERRTLAAHRVAWEMRAGPPPPSMFVLHCCDVKPCVRNDDEGIYEVNGIVRPRFGHLWIGTHEDNMADMARKGRAPQVLHPDRFPHGDDHYSRMQPHRLCRGSQHHRAILRDEQVIEMRALYQEIGLSQHMLARRYGISRGTVQGIVSNKIWKHLLPEWQVAYASR
jgi:hypothetical protein